MVKLHRRARYAYRYADRWYADCALDLCFRIVGYIVAFAFVGVADVDDTADVEVEVVFEADLAPCVHYTGVDAVVGVTDGAGAVAETIYDRWEYRSWAYVDTEPFLAVA